MTQFFESFRGALNEIRNKIEGSLVHFLYFLKLFKIRPTDLPVVEARQVAEQLNHRPLPVLADSTYDSAVIHVRINDLFNKIKSTNDICKYITDIVLRCRNNKIGMIFIFKCII